MDNIVMAIGLVLVIEGLLYAFVPGHLRGMASKLGGLSDEQIRIIGMAALGVGVLLIWLARVFLHA
ncbi:MAG: DUF2065 domain-containing protein [Phyllobacteriaceae bacterium]|nr:DUF2065 domain-containing protein [Phyllobacteriaceae bacterium]